MAKADPTQDQTVEEILASIRQAITAGESKRMPEGRPEPRAEAPKAFVDRRLVSVSAPLPVRDVAAKEPAGTEAKDSAGQGSAGRGDAPPAAPVDRSQMHDVIELAIEQALDDAGEEQSPATAPGGSPSRMDSLTPPPRPLPRAESSPRPQIAQRLGRELPRVAPPSPHRQGLLSPRANAAVATSFGDLARVMASTGGRDIEQTVEELLRPMLRSWLDDNLPSLVERLVREEIERVSRGRR